MREHEVLVGQLDPKHRSREHGNDFSFQFDCFLSIHNVSIGRADARTNERLPCTIKFRITDDCQQIDAAALRAGELR
jgi:hypothetical protein